MIRARRRRRRRRKDSQGFPYEIVKHPKILHQDEAMGEEEEAEEGSGSQGSNDPNP
jgi:hypothetical protein